MLRTAGLLPPRGFRRWAKTQPATGPPGSYPDGTHTRRRRQAYVSVERCLIPAWEAVFVPFIAGMTIAGLAGFARS
jgi:hypothetical protein